MDDPVVSYPLVCPDDIETFADRLEWIIDQDYEDEGASALLPLRQLKRMLRAVEHDLADPSPASHALVRFEYMRLNELK